jgi:hypothetical protein
VACEVIADLVAERGGSHNICSLGADEHAGAVTARARRTAARSEDLVCLLLVLSKHLT